MKTGYEGHKIITRKPNVTVETWCSCKDKSRHQIIEKEQEE